MTTDREARSAGTPSNKCLFSALVRQLLSRDKKSHEEVARFFENRHFAFRKKLTGYGDSYGDRCNNLETD